MTSQRGITQNTPLNTDSALLRLVAIATMICDHAGAIFFPQYIQMRIIGRIAFPLFCWGIVLGCLYTRDWKKYALRLLIGALISQGPYMLALHHSLTELNVMFTLLLGMLAVTGIQKNRGGSALWAPVISLSLAAVFQMDYGWRGVLLMILMYLSREKKTAFAAMMVAFSLFWGATSSDVSAVFGLTSDSFLSSSQHLVRLSGMIRTFLRLQGLAILALPLMLVNTKSGLKLSKWAGYLAYPGHLLLLYGINMLLG